MSKYRRGVVAAQYKVAAAVAPPVLSPTVTSVSPSTGTTAGGTPVSLVGTNFTGATAVSFGSTAASFTVNNPNSISTTSPAESAATVHVSVTNPNGTSPATTSNQFTFSATGSYLPNVASGVLVPQAALMGPGGTYSGEFLSMYNPADTQYGGLDLLTWQPSMYGLGTSQNPGQTFQLNDSLGHPLTIIESDGLHLGFQPSTQYGGCVASGLTVKSNLAPGTPGGYHGFSIPVPTSGSSIFVEAMVKFYGNGSTHTYDWQSWWLFCDPQNQGGVTWPDCGEDDIVETGIHGDSPAWTVITGTFASGPFAGQENNGPGGTNPGYTSAEIGFCTYGMLWTPTTKTMYYNAVEVGSQLIVNPGYDNYGIAGYVQKPMTPVCFPGAPADGGTPSTAPRSDEIVQYIRVWQGPLVAHP